MEYRKINKRIALIGGGTGGHVTPIASLVKYARSIDANASFLWIGESDSMESKFARENAIDFASIASYRIPSMRSFHLFPAAFFRLVCGIFQARKVLKKFGAEILFSKG